MPVVKAEQVLGRAARRGGEPFYRGELDRLVGGDVPRRPVSDDDLQRRGDGGGGQGDAERGPLVPPPPAAQERPRVDPGEDEPGHDVGGEVHVHVLAPEHRVGEQRRPRMHIGCPAVDQGEPRRVVHPPVHGDDEQRPGDPSDRDRDPGKEMRARREPVPAVRVDADEDGLEEEGEPLKREPEPEHVPEVLYPDRPQQTELEGQDRAGHHPDREQREHDPRPPAGERPVEVVPGPQVPPLGEQHDHGKRDPEANQRDVHGQRQRLYLPGLEQVVLGHVHQPPSYIYYYNP
jgi:hypothetical protein